MTDFQLNHIHKSYTDKTGEEIFVERMTVTCESGELSEVIESVNFFINKDIQRQIEERGLKDYKVEIKYSQKALLNRYDYEVYPVGHLFQHTFTPKPWPFVMASTCQALMCIEFATHICESCGKKICKQCSEVKSWGRGCCSKRQMQKTYEQDIFYGPLHSALLDDAD